MTNTVTLCKGVLAILLVKTSSFFQLDYVSLDTVDVILVSNCMSLFALPFMSEKSGFRGLIYTTGPVLELGR